MAFAAPPLCRADLAASAGAGPASGWAAAGAISTFPTLQALAGTWLLRRLRVDVPSTVREAGRFAAAGALSCLVTETGRTAILR